MFYYLLFALTPLVRFFSGPDKHFVKENEWAAEGGSTSVALPDTCQVSHLLSDKVRAAPSVFSLNRPTGPIQS